LPSPRRFVEGVSAVDVFTSCLPCVRRSVHSNRGSEGEKGVAGRNATAHGAKRGAETAKGWREGEVHGSRKQTYRMQRIVQLLLDLSHCLVGPYDKVDVLLCCLVLHTPQPRQRRRQATARHGTGRTATVPLLIISR
jgi:hypothetical protein